MVRVLIVLLFAFFGAHAVAAPNCLPGIYGPQWEGAKNELGTRGRYGWYAYGWCKGEDGAPKLSALICTHGIDCLPWDQIGMKLGDLAFRASTSTKSSVYGSWWDQAIAAGDYCSASNIDPTADLDSLLAKDAKFAMKTAKTNACAEMMSLIDRDKPSYTPLPPPPPPPPPAVYTHAVAPLTGTIDRPARKIINGALVTYSKAARALIGTDCDITVTPTFPSGTDLWAAIPGQANDLRWLCRKK